jgi:hypothetical protein
MTTLQQQGREAFSEVLPLDGLSRFVRAGAWAAMVSGLALIVSMVLAWLVVPYERLGQTEAYLTTSYSVSSGLRLLGLVLLVWGLIGIYGPQSRAAGTFGLWTFVVVFLGTTLAAGNTWAEVFVYPTLTQLAPGMVPGGFTTEAAAYMSVGLTLSYPMFFLEGVMNFSSGTVASGHGYSKTIPKRRFRGGVGVCRPLPRARAGGRPPARVRPARGL